VRERVRVRVCVCEREGERERERGRERERDVEGQEFLCSRILAGEGCHKTTARGGGGGGAVGEVRVFNKQGGEIFGFLAEKLGSFAKM